MKANTQTEHVLQLPFSLVPCPSKDFIWWGGGRERTSRGEEQREREKPQLRHMTIFGRHHFQDMGGGVASWHLVGRDQGCRYASDSARDSSSTPSPHNVLECRY